MAKIKFKLKRENLLQLIVIATALIFILSTLNVWMRSVSSSEGRDSTPSQGNVEETNITTAQAVIDLVIEGYSPTIKFSALNLKNKNLIDELNQQGSILYSNKTDDGYYIIVLKDKSLVYNVSKALLYNDKNLSMLLSAYAYSDKEYSFDPIDNVGPSIKSKVPVSKITVSYPYPIGTALKYDALAKFINGKLVGAKLYPKSSVALTEVPVLVADLGDDYYMQMIFRWSDREKVNGQMEVLNQTLKDLGAKNITFNYISDYSVYSSRELTDDEVKMLETKLEGLKLVDHDRILFYSNYSYNESQVYEAISNITNGTVELEFPVSYLEFSFKLDNYTGEDLKADLLSNYSVEPIYDKLWRKGNISTGDVSVNIKGESYSVPDVKMDAFVDYDSKKDSIASLKLVVYIEGNRIVNLKQDIIAQTPYISASNTKKIN